MGHSKYDTVACLVLDIQLNSYRQLAKSSKVCVSVMNVDMSNHLSAEYYLYYTTL